MNFVAPRARRRRLPGSGRRWSGVGAAALLALAVLATVQDGLAPADAPAPLRVVVVPTPVAGATVAPRVVPVPDRVPVPLVAPTAPPAPVRAPATLPRSEPARVRIPAIDVDSALVALGLRGDGRMEVPPAAFPAGWFTGAPTPGELGPAVLAGHVDYGGVAGVFARLRDLRPGDAVEVARDDGSTATFRVTSVEQHPKDAFPTAAVYGDIDHAGLRLITCGGSFDREAHSYEDNIVVFAELDVDATRGAGA